MANQMLMMDIESEFALYEKNYKKSEVLNVLLEREKELQQTRDLLQRSLSLTHKDMATKVMEVQRLTKKVAVAKLELSQSQDNEENNLAGEGEGVLPMEAVSILPVEVWEIILDNLTNWRDLINCQFTCSLFNVILKKRHPCQTTFMFWEIFPHLYKHLSGKEILNCRLVCEAWSEGIDHFLEDHQSYRPINYNVSQSLQSSWVTPLEEKGLGHLYRLKP